MRRVRLQFFGTVAIIRRSVGQSVCPVAGRSASRRDFCRQTPCWLGISGHSVLCLSSKGPYGQSIVGRFIVSSVGSTTVLSLLSVVWLVVRSIGRLVCRSMPYPSANTLLVRYCRPGGRCSLSVKVLFGQYCRRVRHVVHRCNCRTVAAIGRTLAR